MTNTAAKPGAAVVQLRLGQRGLCRVHGRIANEHRLKTPEYGVEVWDKSRYSAKQVPAWRYNEKAVSRLAVSDNR